MSISRAELKTVRSLQTKKGRRLCRQFSVEGVRTLEEAFRHGALPMKLYYAPATLSERGSALVGKFRSRGVDTIAASPKELDHLTSAVTSPGILGLFATPKTGLAELYRQTMRNVLLCENLSDPGNLGTLSRSALAFGFDLMVLSGRSVEPFAPKPVRASVGALLGIPVAVGATTDVLDFFTGESFAVVAADVNGNEYPDQVLTKLGRRRMLLALGSEAAGLSKEVRQRADYSACIRHETKVESLNTAVAGSILMKECYDSRLRRRQ